MAIEAKAGIMGGTFNPIHNGHLQLAQNAYEALALNKVLFMPSGNSYMKNDVLDCGQRSFMVELAIRSYPHFELSTLETERIGNTYTYETLQLLKKQQPDTHFYFIMGADSLYHIETWKNPDIIFSLATLACAVREHYDMVSLHDKGKELIAKGADIVYLPMKKIDISSSAIRISVKEHQPFSQYVPDSVAAYITQNALYL